MEKPSNKPDSIYYIVVRGQITAALLHVVDDMQIRPQNEDGMVSLIGWLPDQSALMGLLNALNNINYKIIRLQILSKE